MIELYTFPEAFGLRNVSPFCLRVEMALKHLDLPFEITLEHNPGKGPKGKLPFIIDDGQTIADSEIIYQHLDSKSDGGLFGAIDAVDRGRGYAFTRLVDDHLYWMMVASRWLDDAWFDNVRKGFFEAFPPVLRSVIGTIARGQVRKTYKLQGLGRHTLDEQKDFARRDLQALVDGLNGGRYIVGDRMTVFDFTVASLLAGLIDNQPATWISELARDYPALVDYAEGIQAEVGVYARVKP
jgi:glutathione S-transferase